MAVLAPPTLAEVRREVFARVGYAQSGNQTVNVVDQVNSFIRQSHRELYVMMPWLILNQRAQITLSDGVSVYDWPDDTEPGQILSMSVINIDGRMYDVGRGARPNERDSAQYGTGKGRPIVADFDDGVIELFPTPDTNYPKLEVEYFAGMSPLNEDGNRACVDGEALIQRATFKMRDHIGMPITPVMVEQAKNYLDNLRAMQSSGEGCQLGGHQSFRTRVRKTNRVGDQRQRFGTGAPFSTDWSPW